MKLDDPVPVGGCLAICLMLLLGVFFPPLFLVLLAVWILKNLWKVF